MKLEDRVEAYVMGRWYWPSIGAIVLLGGLLWMVI